MISNLSELTHFTPFPDKLMNELCNCKAISHSKRENLYTPQFPWFVKSNKQICLIAGNSTPLGPFNMTERTLLHFFWIKFWVGFPACVNHLGNENNADGANWSCKWMFLVHIRIRFYDHHTGCFGKNDWTEFTCKLDWLITWTMCTNKSLEKACCICWNLG